MAGTPSFTRSKRLIHFHTAHKSIYNGTETKHVKSNYTASIDGTITLTGDSITLSNPVTISDTLALEGAVDCGRNELNNPKNVIRTEKITVTTADLSATSGNDTVGLFRASPGDTVYNIVANSQAAFGIGPATIDTLRFEVGDKADPNGLAMSHLASPIGWIWDGEDGTDKGAYLIGAAPATPVKINKTYTTATMINVVVAASTMYAASMTVGSVDFYIDIMSRA